MPKLMPCNQIGCPNLVKKGYCPEHSKKPSIHQKSKEAERGHAASRGYDRRWRNYRKNYLSNHPLCRMHEDKDEIVAATLVDHIIPVKNKHDPLFWDETNHQPLCRDCHTYKTREIDIKGYGANNLRGKSHPEWLRPSLIPLIIVCGPPASGKTHYVKNHANKSDMIIDLDLIGMELSQSDTEHTWDRNQLDMALRTRNDMLSSLSKKGIKHKRAWFIVSEPDPKQRQWWDDILKPEKIIVLEVPAGECMRRVVETRMNDGRKETHYRLIGEWWLSYFRRDGDEVIKYKNNNDFVD